MGAYIHLLREMPDPIDNTAEYLWKTKGKFCNFP